MTHGRKRFAVFLVGQRKREGGNVGGTWGIFSRLVERYHSEPHDDRGKRERKEVAED